MSWRPWALQIVPTPHAGLRFRNHHRPPPRSAPPRPAQTLPPKASHPHAAMDKFLRKVVVSSMDMIDEHFEGEGPMTLQLQVDHVTPLADAVEINRRMQAGVRDLHAFQVFNPEVVARKVEAEAAVRGVLDQINVRIDDANREIEDTQELLVAVQLALAPGPDAIRVGPSINRRAVAGAGGYPCTCGNNVCCLLLFGLFLRPFW